MSAMEPSRWNMVHAARREWERLLRQRKLTEEAQEQVLTRVYAALDLPPAPLYRVQSPLAAMLLIPHLGAFHRVTMPEAYLLEMLLDPLTSSLGETEAWGRFGGRLGFDAAFSRPIKEQLSVAFVEGFTDQLGDTLRKLGGEDFAQGRIRSGIFKPIPDKITAWWRKICGTNCRWWLFGKFSVVCTSEYATDPEDIDDQGRLHCEDGPVHKYPDGCEIYSWHGIQVPEHAIRKPESITLQEVDAALNVELRRALIERMGAGAYLMKSGAELVDMDSLTLDGSAPRALLRDKYGNMWLVGTDGSTERVYTMAVPRDVRSCRAAHIAICGFDEALLVAEA